MQELRILPSLSMEIWSFRQPLRFFFPLDQGPSPWIPKPVLSTMICSGLLFGCWTLIFGLIVFPLRDKVVWSGTASLSFISWNIEVTKPSVCLRGRWKMSRKDKTVSIALSEKRCCPPLFFDVRGFQDLMTDGDIQIVKEPLLHRYCSYSFQLVPLYFFLSFGLRLLLCFIKFLHHILHLNAESNTTNLFIHQSRIKDICKCQRQNSYLFDYLLTSFF